MKQSKIWETKAISLHEDFSMNIGKCWLFQFCGKEDDRPWHSYTRLWSFDSRRSGRQPHYVSVPQTPPRRESVSSSLEFDFHLIFTFPKENSTVMLLFEHIISILSPIYSNPSRSALELRGNERRSKCLVLTKNDFPERRTMKNLHSSKELVRDHLDISVIQNI